MTTLLATPAFAADSADTNGTTVETLIVTAEKRAQPEIEVPTSLSVVTAKDIQDKKLISVSDISNRLPNVDISGSSHLPADHHPGCDEPGQRRQSGLCAGGRGLCR